MLKLKQGNKLTEINPCTHNRDPQHRAWGSGSRNRSSAITRSKCHVTNTWLKKECIAKKLSQMPCTPTQKNTQYTVFSTSYCFALFIPLHILLLFLFFYHMYALVLLLLYYFYFLFFCTVHWADLISLLIIPCIIFYVTNKETLNLEEESTWPGKKSPSAFLWRLL